MNIFSCYQAASVAGCSDLASLERSVFISSGGAGDWLRKCPAKLVKLEEVNMLLCRNPRLIKHHHIKVNFTLQWEPYQTLTLQRLTRQRLCFWFWFSFVNLTLNALFTFLKVKSCFIFFCFRISQMEKKVFQYLKLCKHWVSWVVKYKIVSWKVFSVIKLFYFSDSDPHSCSVNICTGQFKTSNSKIIKRCRNWIAKNLREEVHWISWHLRQESGDKNLEKTSEQSSRRAEAQEKFLWGWSRRYLQHQWQSWGWDQETDWIRGCEDKLSVWRQVLWWYSGSGLQLGWTRLLCTLHILPGTSCDIRW